MSRVRWTRGIAAVAFVSGGVLIGTSLPASANTNFNGSCESSEACIWDGDYNEGPLWDYEGTDTNFTNNTYARSSRALNNTGTGFENKGTSCTAVVGENVGGASAQGWTLRLARGAQVSLYRDSARNNEASSLWWSC